MGVLDWIIEAFSTVINAVGSVIKAMYDVADYLINLLLSSVMDLVVAIAKLLLSALPAPVSYTPGVTHFGQWFWDAMALMNIFIDMNALGLVLVVMFLFEIGFLSIYVILWIKRFIPGMGF